MAQTALPRKSAIIDASIGNRLERRGAQRPKGSSRAERLAMIDIIARRVCAEVEGDFVVFLIGIRINRFMRVGRWLPVFSAMPRMLAELEAKPDLGLMHYRTHFGLRNTLMVQYWRSAAQLQAYASSRDGAHLPAWRDFNRAVGTSGDVGIWHETYLVGPGRSESIYVNMPPYGMGRAGRIVDAEGQRATARHRLRVAGGGDGGAALKPSGTSAAIDDIASREPRP